MRRTPHHRQRGVALLLAVLLTALAAVLAFSILDDQSVALARSHALNRAAKTDEFARGAEAIAAIALRRDQALEAGLDSNTDIWRQPLVLELPQGRLTARMRDLNGCFNVNALASTDEALAAESYARLRRLLRVLRVDPELADAIADYVDSDREARPRGAEDLRYLGARPPSRSADQPIAHVSELRGVAGVDASIYAQLENDLCARPQLSPINVNTASVAVLQSLAERLERPAAEALASDGNARHAGIDAFLRAVESAGVQPPPATGLGVSSDEFLLESLIEFDGIEVAYWSLLSRRDGQVLVHARGRGRFR